jgi:hypothetical protein
VCGGHQQNRGQLFADEHINNARAAKARAPGDDPLRLAFQLADDPGIAAIKGSLACVR